MRVRRDQQFDEERERFCFLYCCEDCGHFNPDTESCCHFWPTREHRRAYYDGPAEELVFCKEFELR